MRDAATFLASALALGVLALGGWRASTMRERDLAGEREAGLCDDRDRVRSLLGLIVERGTLPMKEGALDPYDLVRSGDIAQNDFGLFRSERLGIGPTDEEIRRGDYRHFPWQRYRGNRVDIGPPGFPLIWGRVNEKGWTLVGFSDGSVRMMEADEVEELGLGR